MEYCLSAIQATIEVYSERMGCTVNVLGGAVVGHVIGLGGGNQLGLVEAIPNLPAIQATIKVFRRWVVG